METTEWADLDDDALLEKKISQLGLTLTDTPLQAMVQQLHDELTAKGLGLHPPCHVGDEWFVPVGIPAIFVPFFLTHDRLRRLEKAMMLEVEGESPEWFMRLMRHEAAHAYAYAYQLTRKKKWQRVFGLTSTDTTPDFYRPRPYSHSYVVHLDDWYAQSHPDEDFAETFAVWLTPGLDWRTRFKGWKALQKLEYLDELMRSYHQERSVSSVGLRLDRRVVADDDRRRHPVAMVERGDPPCRRRIRIDVDVPERHAERPEAAGHDGGVFTGCRPEHGDRRGHLAVVHQDGAAVVASLVRPIRTRQTSGPCSR